MSKTVEVEYYMRQTTVGAVKVGIGLGLDDSSSHLNPAVRVTRLMFWLDKNVKLRDAVGAIAELRAICAAGCDIVGEVDEPYVHSARVTAPPHNEAEKQLARNLVRSDMHFYTPDPDKARAAERATFTILVDYQKPSSPQEFNFETTPVSQLTLAVTDPVQHKEFDKTISSAGKVVTLPVYKP